MKDDVMKSSKQSRITTEADGSFGFGFWSEAKVLMIER